MIFVYMPLFLFCGVAGSHGGEGRDEPPRGYCIPLVDLAGETHRQIIVDRNPRELPGALTGDRHCGRYAPDGRLFVSFRGTTLVSPTRGDWVGWVGTYDDIVKRREGQYRVRLMDNTKGLDCAYPAVEVLPDGTFVATTYGHWTDGQRPFIVSVRFTLDELDAKAAEMRQKR
jgi:hypothetical protein